MRLVLFTTAFLCVIGSLYAQSERELSTRKDDLIKRAVEYKILSDSLYREYCRIEEARNMLPNMARILEYDLNSEKADYKRRLDKFVMDSAKARSVVNRYDALKAERYDKYVIDAIASSDKVLYELNKGDEAYRMDMNGTRLYYKNTARKNISFHSTDAVKITPYNKEKYRELTETNMDDFIILEKSNNSGSIYTAVKVPKETIIKNLDIVGFQDFQPEDLNAALENAMSVLGRTGPKIDSTIMSKVAEYSNTMKLYNDSLHKLSAASEEYRKIYEAEYERIKPFIREIDEKLADMDSARRKSEFIAALSPEYGESIANRLYDKEVWIGMSENMIASAGYYTSTYYVSNTKKLMTVIPFPERYYVEISNGKIEKISTIPLKP